MSADSITEEVGHVRRMEAKLISVTGQTRAETRVRS